jgi:hypothetical protein
MYPFDSVDRPEPLGNEEFRQLRQGGPIDPEGLGVQDDASPNDIEVGEITACPFEDRQGREAVDKDPVRCGGSVGLTGVKQPIKAAFRHGTGPEVAQIRPNGP